jgi:hypothetical protein
MDTSTIFFFFFSKLVSVSVYGKVFSAGAVTFGFLKAAKKTHTIQSKMRTPQNISIPI